MTQWTDSILVSEGQTVHTTVLIRSEKEPSLIFQVSHPSISLSSLWDGNSFVSTIQEGSDFILSQTFVVGVENEYQYRISYRVTTSGTSEILATSADYCEFLETSFKVMEV